MPWRQKATRVAEFRGSPFLPAAPFPRHRINPCRGGEAILKGALASISFVIAAAVALPAHSAVDIATRVQACATCHGENGKPTSTANPIIWGQQANYLYKELHDYHSGERANSNMSSTVKPYSLSDLREVANYFAAKPWPAVTNAAASVPPASVAMCKACHGQNFEGGAPAPRLAGLSYQYLIGTMDSFADGKRTNNLDMPGFMKVLTESDRVAIARYLSSL